MTRTVQNFTCDVDKIQGRPVVRLADARSGLTACVSPEDGGELSGLSVLDGSTRHELLYNANNWRPVPGWPGKAPWLWPVAGRAYAPAENPRSNPSTSFTPRCSWETQGEIRHIEPHGFARLRRWELGTLAAGPDDAVAHVSLQSRDDDKATYPFDFRLEAVTEAVSDGLRLTLRVSADRRNSSLMPFTTGSHLTWDLSSWWGAQWLQGTIHGLGDHAWSTDQNGLASARVGLPHEAVLMSDARIRTAIIPAAAGRAVRLVSPDRYRQISLSMETSRLPSEDAAIWVTYCDPQQRFFCIEPWIGWPNGINTGRGRIELEPGEDWEFSVYLRVAPCYPSATSADKSAPARVDKPVTKRMLDAEPTASTGNLKSAGVEPIDKRG